MFFIQHLLGLSEEGFIFLLVEFLNIVGRDLVGSFSVHLKHSLFPGLGSCELLILLFFKKFPLLGGLFFGLNLSGLLHPV
jgi:hypothetical protein